MAGAAASSFGDEDGGVISDINVTPLVDVTLVLLIVFMITVPAIVGSAPIKVDVPESSSSGIGDVEQLPLNLFIKLEDGAIVLYVNESKTDVASFPKLVNSIRTPGVEQPVYLSADKSIPYAEVIKVIDMLGELNMHKLSLMTKHVNGR
jgi:biopolymer transport protein ExbD